MKMCFERAKTFLEHFRISVKVIALTRRYNKKKLFWKTSQGQNFSEKHLCRSFLKKETLAQVFSCAFYDIFYKRFSLNILDELRL